MAAKPTSSPSTATSARVESYMNVEYYNAIGGGFCNDIKAAYVAIGSEVIHVKEIVSLIIRM